MTKKVMLEALDKVYNDIKARIEKGEIVHIHFSEGRDYSGNKVGNDLYIIELKPHEKAPVRVAKEVVKETISDGSQG